MYSKVTWQVRLKCKKLWVWHVYWIDEEIFKTQVTQHCVSGVNHLLQAAIVEWPVAKSYNFILPFEEDFNYQFPYNYFAYVAFFASCHSGHVKKKPFKFIDIPISYTVCHKYHFKWVHKIADSNYSIKEMLLIDTMELTMSNSHS